MNRVELEFWLNVGAIFLAVMMLIAICIAAVTPQKDGDDATKEKQNP